jgi:CheY-like chemotaxis protein
MILIVAGNLDLACVWARHLKRQKQTVKSVESVQEAVDFLRNNIVQVIVLDLMLDRAGAFSVADYASYRQPFTRIVFVTRKTFFSDGSLFQHIPNTAAILQEDSPPSDLAEIVAYHGRVC